MLSDSPPSHSLSDVTPRSWEIAHAKDGEPKPIPLRVDYKRINTFFADYAKNISKGETFIQTDRPSQVGTEFLFILSVPERSAPFEFRGEVAWITTPEHATSGKPAGMGIRYKFKNEDERRKTDATVEAMMREILGDHISAKLLSRKLT